MFNFIANIFNKNEVIENDAPLAEPKEEYSTFLKCVACAQRLEIYEMLSNIYCFGGEAIVFDCPYCKYRQYFYPYTDFVEVGALGCSPVVDPIPVYKYSLRLQYYRYRHSIEIIHGAFQYKVPSSLATKDGASIEKLEIAP